MYPILPTEGDRITLFGVDVEVQFVEPETDWAWRIECRTAADQQAVFIVPTEVRTDTRTDDVTVAWDRKETDPCQRGTVGCSTEHNYKSECETW